ncbi:glycoside hydrolase family 15 protein [Streptomyces seoulensis]|uniref:glycoside hydrolase family 15 protein n=1 Tax=Streptomyces seoulensis TaxID=73044 RepID=UPI001FCC9DCF|nr:glycoside hydrolase family 15 protein [Streptomyces seoulensis]BDH07141.1 glucoamylase [Streptomyces seoulensis]
MTTTPYIERHALIGDLRTCALVRDDGSINWLCLPRFDSDAVCAALLGGPEHGSWSLAPAPGDDADHLSAASRGYRGDTLVLETEWRTGAGSVRVVDFMPPGTSTPQVIRIVEGLTGEVRMVSRLRPMPGYGRTVPWIHDQGGRMVAQAGADAYWLDTSAKQMEKDGAVVSGFAVAAGQSVAFVLSYWPAHAADAPEVADPEAALDATLAGWQDWALRCTYTGPYHKAVARSAIALKAMTYAPSGGIVAAPTTSLPEEIGGVRNWDYRYTWLRDSAVTVAALLRTGHRSGALAWRRWLLAAVGGDPQNLQIMYGLCGERELPERELGWLPGYEDSAPVRVGNGAVDQLQLDVYGEAIEALYLAYRHGLAPCPDTVVLHQRLVQQVIERWREPDAGIWEIRGPRRPFVHSKVMAWVALNRTICMAEDGVLDVDLAELRAVREEIHREVCERGFDPVRNTFTQYYDSRELDAALLLIPRVGFLPADDPRVIGTVAAVQRELATAGGLVHRYPTQGSDVGVDGLRGSEGTFLLCSFWLVDALALTGRLAEARVLFEHLLSLRNDLGLLAEEYDPVARRQLGNFPQAFSHAGLIESALLLQRCAWAASSPDVVLPPESAVLAHIAPPPWHTPAA